MFRQGRPLVMMAIPEREGLAIIGDFEDVVVVDDMAMGRTRTVN